MFYIQQDEKIVLVDENLERLQNTIAFIPQYEGLEIQETERPLVLSEDMTYYVFADTDEYLQEQAQKREQEFNKEFFLTSLGYIRRNVNMANGSTKDFICDIVPALQAGLSQGKATPIITYELPDFTQEITTEYLETLQEVKPVTAEFLQECLMQLSNDFMPQGLSVPPAVAETVNESEESEPEEEEENASETDTAN